VASLDVSLTENRPSTTHGFSEWMPKVQLLEISRENGLLKVTLAHLQKYKAYCPVSEGVEMIHKKLIRSL